MERVVIFDPMTRKSYDYEISNKKEERLFHALQGALKDECPPDRKDYLCMIDATEEEDCENCWLRWATKDFAVSKN